MSCLCSAGRAGLFHLDVLVGRRCRTLVGLRGPDGHQLRLQVVGGVGIGRGHDTLAVLPVLVASLKSKVPYSKTNIFYSC